MHRDDGKHYELGCYVVMPNHVHAVVRPLCPAATPLEEVLRLWKGSSSRAMNQALDSVGPVWQRESYDRIIRDAEHLYRVLQYIGNNPVKAKLPVGAYRLWIRPDWVKQGWNFTHPSSHFNPAAPS
jgi:REP element-mobilizing transposase RayT